MSEIDTTLLSILSVLVLAFGVRLVVDAVRDLSYASVLVFISVVVSALGLTLHIDLTHDLIIVVLLPPLLFQATIGLDLTELRADLPLVLTMTLIGLPVAVLVLGWLGTIVFEFPLVVSLLFAAIILPTDPAAVVSLFEEFDAPDRLSVTMEGESLLNDGIAIVIFSTLLAKLREPQQPGHAINEFGGFVIDLILVGGGGFLLGGAIGYVAHHITSRLTDRMTTLLLTVILAYGSFFLADHYLGVSGVLATVGAGLVMGAHNEVHPDISGHVDFLEEIWEAAAFLVNTLIYILIGAEVRIADFVQHVELVVLAVVLVVIVRALVTYPLIALLNQEISGSIPVYCQNIIILGGLHTVVPVALALALPSGVPHQKEIQTMVFGVAIISLVVQGLLMPTFLRMAGVAGEETMS